MNDRVKKRMTAVALYAPPAVLRAFQARGYTSLALEAHREAVARAARFAAVGPITPTRKAVALSRDVCWPPAPEKPFPAPPAPEPADPAWPRLKPSAGSPAALAIIKREVCREWAVEPADIDGPRRERSIVVPRHVAMWLARHVAQRSLPDIARRFGGHPEHTIVLHAVRATAARMAADPEFAGRVERARARVEGELATAACAPAGSGVACGKVGRRAGGLEPPLRSQGKGEGSHDRLQQ